MLPRSFLKLISALQRLPSIGEKSAQRLAYFLVQEEEDIAKSLANAIKEAKEKIKMCKICCAYTEEEVCKLCSDPLRNKSLLCVVEKPSDIEVIEQMGEYKGLYHVLHGLWSPLKGIHIEDLTITKLVERVEKEEVKEILLALSFTTEGEATSSYIMNLFQGKAEVEISRLAQGVPQGGQLEYIDSLTLKQAFIRRRRI